MTNYINLSITGVVLYYLLKNKDKLGGLFSGLVPSAAAPSTEAPAEPAPSKGKGKGGGGAAPSAGTGGGGAPSGKSGCNSAVYGTGAAKMATNSGKSTRHFASDGSSGTVEWNADGINWPAAEALVYITPGGCSDNSDIKLWGPHHSDGACCWCLASIEWKDGSVYFGGEGPHPKTAKTQQKIGSIKKGAKIGLLFAIWPGAGGAHQECYVDDGGGWRKVGQRDGPCGNAKKETKPVSGYQAQFRTDCNGVKYECPQIRQITGKGSAYARAMGVAYNGHTDSLRYRKSFYTKHSGYHKAYRTTIARKQAFFVTVENYRSGDHLETFARDIPKTDTEKEDYIVEESPYPYYFSPANVGR